MSLSPPLPLRDLLDTSLYAGVKVCLQLQHHLFHLCYQPKNLLFCHAQVSHLGHLGNRIAQWCHLSAPTKYLFQKEQNQLFFKVILPASCVSLYNWYWGDNIFAMELGFCQLWQLGLLLCSCSIGFTNMLCHLVAHKQISDDVVRPTVRSWSSYWLDCIKHALRPDQNKGVGYQVIKVVTVNFPHSHLLQFRTNNFSTQDVVVPDVVVQAWN